MTHAAARFVRAVVIPGMTAIAAIPVIRGAGQGIAAIAPLLITFFSASRLLSGLSAAACART